MLTPAMQQYYDIKKEYNDSIIFFRMGDFYEMFGEDAHIAHKVLGINITSRNKNAINPESLAGIPYHAKDKYLPQLINAGYKVAIVEQVSDPKLKGIVKREVVRVVTPATLSLEGDIYDNFDNNVIISITSTKNIFGLSVLDISSNKWQTREFSSFDLLQKELYKINPKEVILEKSLFNDEKIKETLQKKYSLNIYYFEIKELPKQKLLHHFKVKDLSGFGIEKFDEAIKSSALLLAYLEQNQKQTLTNFDIIGVYSNSNFLEIDNSTIKNLDLIYNFATGSENIGTLFGVLNQTKTSSGKRLLRENILKPLKDEKSIKARLDFVQEFLNDKILLDKVREKLSYICDIDAILNRLVLDRSSPRDLLNLKKSLQSILEIIEIIKKDGSEKLKKYFND
ncbi:MAG: hypothetical protein PHE25_04650 [Candidatus Gracilibacteria bacterium]|nr:hypothetical protein [Candidatus Gracilibacteria bacterium]